MIKTNLGKIAITNKGVYSAATTYETLDVVSFNGSSYMAKQQTVGNSPENTNYWQLLAAKGDTPVKGVDYFTQADIASLPQPDLSGYALASDVYSKDDVDDMLALIESSALKRIIVQELPAVNISSNAIYMIRNLSAEGQNQYDEFMWNENDGSGRWEYIGNTQVDLTGYATESWVNNQGFLKTHQDISGKANSADLATVATTGDYTDLINTPTIPVMPTLANVATSGSYNDLSNKPSIPTKTSDLTNDSGFLTSHQDISGKQDVLPDLPEGEEDKVFALTRMEDGSFDWFQLTDWMSASEQDQQILLGDYAIDIGSGLSLIEDPDSDGLNFTLEASGSSGGATYTAGNGIDIDANNVIRNNYQSVFGLMMLSNNTSKSMNPYITSASGMTWEQFLSALQTGKIVSTVNVSETWINAGSKQLNAANVAGDANATYYICDLTDGPSFNFYTTTARALSGRVYFFDGTVLYTYSNSVQFLDWLNFDDGTNTTKKLGTVIRDLQSSIPAAPSSDGNYVLKCSVVSGVPTYTWEAVTVGGSY